MSSSTLSRSQQKALVATWQETGRLLEAQRYRELAAQTPEASRQAAYDMLRLGGKLPDTRACQTSGLIEMQRLFARFHLRGRA